MPYSFGHPAAILPLKRPMGRFAVLIWFCLPAGLAAYLAFHLLLKEPLIALRAPWHAVGVSLLAGAMTHIAWDGLARTGEDLWRHNWLQHASTLLGTVMLGAWLGHKLRETPPAARRISPFGRLCALVALAGAMLVCALWSADSALALDSAALRHFARTAGIGALQGLAAALVVYCALFRPKTRPQ